MQFTYTYLIGSKLTIVRNTFIKEIIMGCFRALICIVCPPLSVLDKGCGSILIVSLLTICGWIPGVIAAIVICNK